MTKACADDGHRRRSAFYGCVVTTTTVSREIDQAWKAREAALVDRTTGGRDYCHRLAIATDASVTAAITPVTSNCTMWCRAQKVAAMKQKI